MIGLHIDHFYVFWLEPLATNKTKEHMQMYYIGEKSANGEELKELRKENAKILERCNVGRYKCNRRNAGRKRFTNL